MKEPDVPLEIRRLRCDAIDCLGNVFRFNTSSANMFTKIPMVGKFFGNKPEEVNKAWPVLSKVPIINTLFIGDDPLINKVPMIDKLLAIGGTSGSEAGDAATD